MRLTYNAALEDAVACAMRDDPDVFMMSTAVPPGLAAEFGPGRARTAPISEPAMTGLAVGAAGAGKRPIVYWRNITFAFNAFDQVANQAAKVRYMFGGQRSFPIVFRAVCGGGQRMAAQHSQSPHSIYSHIAGLKVIMPSNPADARGLLAAAIADDNPVLCLEPARAGALEADVLDDIVVELGRAATPRSGDDVTIVAVGYMVTLALEAAEELASDRISAEVIDVRTVSPLDRETIRDSVRRTGALVVVDEAPAMCSLAAEVTALVAEDATTFDALSGPPVRVCGLPVPVPFSAVMENHVLPDVARIVAGAMKALGQ